MNNTQIAGAVVVARVSSDPQVEGTSLDGQLEAGCKKAGLMGLDVLYQFKEEGRSGAYYGVRPEMQEAIRLIEQGKTSHLITLNLTRFARDTEVSTRIKKAVEGSGGTLIFVDWAYVKSATGNFQFNVMSAVSQLERDQIIERTTGGRRRKAEGGTQPSRAWSPWGYHIVSKIDVLLGRNRAEALGSYELAEPAARWVPEAFGRFQGGASLRDVCRWLEHSGVPTPRGGAFWRPSTLKRIFENPTYKGTAPFARHENLYDENRLERGLKLVTKRARPQEQWVFIPCPALVSAATWEAVQTRLREGRERFGGNPVHRHLLSGLLRCPVCGRGMGGTRRERQTKAGGTTREHHYHCLHSRPSRNVGGMVCNPQHYPADRAEAVVMRALGDVAAEPGLVAAALAAHRSERSTGYSQADHDRVTAELSALGAREAATVELSIAARTSGLSAAPYLSKMKEIAEKQATLQQRVQEMDGLREQADGKVDQAGALALSETVDAVRQALDSPLLTDGEKHGLIARVVTEIVPAEENGEEGYRMTLKPFSSTTVATVSLLCSVSTTLVEVVPRRRAA